MGSFGGLLFFQGLLFCIACWLMSENRDQNYTPNFSCLEQESETSSIYSLIPEVEVTCSMGSTLELNDWSPNIPHFFFARSIPSSAFQTQYFYGSSFLAPSLFFLFYFLIFTLFEFFSQFSWFQEMGHSSTQHTTFCAYKCKLLLGVWNFLPNLKPDFRPLKFLSCCLWVFLLP